MFSRTVSFWRRLLGRPATTTGGGTAVEEEDRRAWHRFQADYPTTILATGQSGGTHVPAQIHDISVGGVRLCADQSFTEGDLLTIELPGVTEQERTTALACVVHVQPTPEGRWMLGCTFSRELTEADLHALGVQRRRNGPTDQRAWHRFPCDLTATFQAITDQNDPPVRARVLDLSASGVGLLVQGDIENGTLLSVELRSAGGDFTRVMLACVVHVTAQADGNLALGCNFIRSLSEGDLRSLV